MQVEPIPSENPPPPFGVNPDFLRNEELSHFQSQQGFNTKFTEDPNMMDAQQGMYGQQEYFQGIDGMLRPVIRQGRQGPNYFSPRSENQLRRPFREDPIGNLYSINRPNHLALHWCL